MARLSKQQKALLKLLNSSREGDLVSKDTLLSSTGWDATSLGTHLSKNKLVEFLEEVPGGMFRMLRSGQTVTDDDVHRAMTQVSPRTLTLGKGNVLHGASGTYTLQAALGEGAVSHVWAGRDADREIAVAIKVVIPRPDLLDPSRLGNIRARFRREALQGMKLQHECVVRILDHGEFKSHPFLVMELAQRSLGKRLKDNGPLSTRESLTVIDRCVSGLKYLHESSCVHRDVKPDNLLETKRGVIVGDLGIMRWGDMNPAFTSAATMTKKSVQLGSWFYMAPEQLESAHEANPMSDVYALGVTWYELLTGLVPSPAQFAAKRYTSPCEVTEICSTIAAMTSFSPEDRPSLRDVAGIVAQLQASGSS